VKSIHQVNLEQIHPFLMSHDRVLPALHLPCVSQTLFHNLCVGSGGLHNCFTGM